RNSGDRTCRARAVQKDYRNDQQNPDQLRRAQTEQRAPIVSAPELDQEAERRVESDESQKHLAVVALFAVKPENQKSRDRKGADRFVDLSRMHRQRGLERRRKLLE